MQEILIYYVLPNILLFGGIYGFCKMAEVVFERVMHMDWKMK